MIFIRLSHMNKRAVGMGFFARSAILSGEDFYMEERRGTAIETLCYVALISSPHDWFVTSARCLIDLIVEGYFGRNGVLAFVGEIGGLCRWKSRRITEIGKGWSIGVMCAVRYSLAA
jgi:hypothetical protein